MTVDLHCVVVVGCTRHQNRDNKTTGGCHLPARALRNEVGLFTSAFGESVAKAVTPAAEGSSSGVARAVRHGLTELPLSRLRLTELPLSRLRDGPSVRVGGIDRAHVQVLVESVGPWPPILVTDAGHWILDGRHRVHAAKLLGWTSITCEVFDGTPEGGFVEAVRRNARHGKPLTLVERETAVSRILALHPEWSDRRVADLASVSAKRVARLRRMCPSAATTQLDTRLGRDGRMRPVDVRALRTRIAQAIEANPDASLRAIARAVGASPETVRSVRAQMAEPEPKVCDSEIAVPYPHPLDGTATHRASAATEDRALTATEHGTRFAEWFTRTAIDASWRDWVAVPPVSRLYGLADEARRRSAHWNAFATELERGVGQRERATRSAS